MVQDSSPATANLSSLGEAGALTVAPGDGVPGVASATTEMTTVQVSVPFKWITPLGLVEIATAGDASGGVGVGMTLQAESRMLCVG